MQRSGPTTEEDFVQIKHRFIAPLAASLLMLALPAGAAFAQASQVQPSTSGADGTGVPKANSDRANPTHAGRYRRAHSTRRPHFGGISKGQNAAKRKTDTHNGS